MQGNSLAKRWVDNWPLGLAVAAGLACLPLVNWLGVILAVLIMLRHGGLWASLGYVVVSILAYFTLSGYSFSLVAQEWGAVLMTFGPLWAMAWVLRNVRSMSYALAGGVLVFMAMLLLMRLFQGPPSVDEWVTFFDCRLKAAGMSQEQMMEFVPGHDFRGAIQAFMIGWPLSLSLLQIGLLFAARWLQARCYYPGGFQADFHNLKQPRNLALGCAGLLLMAVFAPDNMVTLLHMGILAMVLMGVTGLGQVHGYIAEKHRSGWWLVLVYFLLALNTWGTLIALAIIGILRSTGISLYRDRKP